MIFGKPKLRTSQFAVRHLRDFENPAARLDVLKAEVARPRLDFRRRDRRPVEFCDFAKLFRHPVHFSIPSNSFRPFSISASSFASRERINFGESCSTASYATSL